MSSSANRYVGLHAVERLDAPEELREWKIDPFLVVELEDPGLEQEHVRLLPSDDPLELGHDRLRFLERGGLVELVEQRLELGVVEAGVVVASRHDRQVLRSEERPHER